MVLRYKNGQLTVRKVLSRRSSNGRGTVAAIMFFFFSVLLFLENIKISHKAVKWSLENFLNNFPSIFHMETEKI